jgi:hypothetical protein
MVPCPPEPNALDTGFDLERRRDRRDLFHEFQTLPKRRDEEIFKPHLACA